MIKRIEDFVINEVKEAVFNPITVFEYIMDISLPDDSMPYTSVLYTTLYDLFMSLFSDMFIDRVDKILETNKISDDKIVKIYNRNKLNAYVQLMDVIDEDIRNVQEEICESLNKGENADIIRVNLNKLLSNLEINTDIIISEICDNSFKEYSDIKGACNHLCGSLLWVINCLMDKGEIKMGKKNKSGKVVTEWKSDDNGIVSFDISHKETMKVRNTKKKRDLEDLKDNVNKLDKSQGCSLKHPRNTVDDENELVSKADEYRLILSKMLFMLNNVSDKNYIKYNKMFGYELKKIKINKRFKEESVWFNYESSSVYTMKFKVRFLTYLIKWVIKNLYAISGVCYFINGDGKFIEFDIKLEYIEDVVVRLANIICKVLRNEDYGQDLLFFSDIDMYLSSNMDNLKKINRKVQNIYDQTFLLSIRFKPFSQADQDVSMDTLLKMAYMVSTYDPKIKGRIDFPEGYKFRNSQMSKRVIEDLGYSIISSRKKYGTPRLFKYFVKSDPEIYARWKEADSDEALIVGIVALKYYAFLCNNTRITKKIESIIER